MLICQDTIYFGVSDSLIHLPKGTEYKLQRNILLRNNVFYEKKPDKKDQVEERVIKYYELWNKAASYTIKDTARTVDNSISSAELYFQKYEGKVIRSISFKTKPMFDNEEKDTTNNALNNLDNYLNKLHVSTQEHVIRNNLRIKENERIKARRMSENERLIRQLRYIEDARFEIRQEDFLADSVDIVIITQDKFPLGIGFHMSDYDEYTISLYNSNLLGLGHYIESGLYFNGRETPMFGYELNYQTRNLAGSFVDIGAYRAYNYKENNYGILVERRFLSTDMKFGGAFKYDDIRQTRRYMPESQDTTLSSPYQAQIYDGWLGKTFITSPSGKHANLSIAARHYNENYVSRPQVTPELNLVFHDFKVTLASIMIQKVNFIQTYKLSEFGVTEDIPIGYSFKATAGHSWNEFYDRPYLGLDFNTQIVRPKKGILNINTSAGSFYNDLGTEDAIAKISVNYYSSLKQLGSYSMRHFILTTCNILFNDRYYEKLNFRDKNMGWIQKGITANSTIAIQYKPTFHFPISIAGFKLSAAPFTTLGIATNSEVFIGHKQVYTVHGFSFKTKNESLTFPTVGVDISYYPIYGEKRHNFAITAYAKDTRIFESLFSPKPRLNKSY